MSAHPNVLLMAVMTPDNSSRETYDAILKDNGLEGEDDVLRIGDELVFSVVMEDEHDRDYQILAKEGDLVFFMMPTFGYGHSILWVELVAMYEKLVTWTREMSAKHHCTYQIRVSANYW